MAHTSDTASWLVSTFQLSGTPDTYFYNTNNIITSILPRQEERREAEESERDVRGRGRREEEVEGRGNERTDTHERAQARESTRWMPRR